MNPYVKSVHPLDNHRLEILFENGQRVPNSGKAPIALRDCHVRDAEEFRHWLEEAIAQAELDAPSG